MRQELRQGRARETRSDPLCSGQSDPYLLQAAELAIACAASDPRTVPALLDRLRSDPQREIRKMIASRMLYLFTDHPDVVPALQEAAAGDGDAVVRWAARYALRLGNPSMQ